MNSIDQGGDPKYFSIERYITYIPLLAPLLAVTYVGVFYAIEINFFTLFSLSEHVLFALQALPVAIFILLLAAIFLPLIASEPKKTQPAPPPLWVRKRPWLAKLIAFTIIGLFLIGIVVFIGYQLKTMIDRLLIAYMFVFVFIPIAVTTFIRTRFHQIQIVVTATLVCLFMSLLFGIAWGVGLRQAGGSSIVELKTSEPPVVVVVVRSGERGVLLYDRASDRLRFEPWDGIKSVQGPAIKFREF